MISYSYKIREISYKLTSFDQTTLALLETGADFTKNIRYELAIQSIKYKISDLMTSMLSDLMRITKAIDYGNEDYSKLARIIQLYAEHINAVNLSLSYRAESHLNAEVYAGQILSDKASKYIRILTDTINYNKDILKKLRDI